MKIILIKDFKDLGKKGETLNVKDGYARNFLIPKGYAYEFSAGNMKRFEENKKYQKIKDVKDKRAAEEMIEKMKDVSITIKQKAHDDDMLYGSVNQMMIAESLNEIGFDIEKNSIILDEHIKKIGVYTVKIKLHPFVIADIKLWVIKDE